MNTKQIYVCIMYMVILYMYTKRSGVQMAFFVFIEFLTSYPRVVFFSLVIQYFTKNCSSYCVAIKEDPCNINPTQVVDLPYQPNVICILYAHVEIVAVVAHITLSEL